MGELRKGLNVFGLNEKTPLSHSKLMTKKSNYDFKGKYPMLIMLIIVILTKSRFFATNMKKEHYGIEFGKEVKTIIDVVISLHPLRRACPTTMRVTKQFSKLCLFNQSFQQTFQSLLQF